MKKLLIVIAVVLVACNEKPSSPAKVITITVHDTISALTKQTDSIIKSLLMDYYKGGYMDGSDNIIELVNNQKFDDSHIEKRRFAAFRKIETDVNNKSIYK